MPHENRKSKSAFVLLNITGFFLLIIGSGLLVAGCFLVYHESFEVLQDNISMEYDYSHYWVGGIYLITAVLTFCSGCRQNRRRLTFITAMFLLFSITLSLFAIVLDGPAWVKWKNAERGLKFWENKQGYSCHSKNDKSCTCSQDNGLNRQTVSDLIKCDKIMTVTIIYGVIISGCIVGLVLCLSTFFVMVNSISWKNPWKNYTSYSTSYVNRGKFTSLDDVMEMYKQDHRYHTMVSSSNSTMTRANSDYTPAWSLYGSAADHLHY